MDNGYDYDELFPGRFLKSGELKGREVTLKITGVTIEELPDKRGTKINKDGERVRVRGVISFEKTDKQLVLNKTNGECFRALWGRKTSDWIGKRVTFYPAVVDAFGEQKAAIRVRGSPDLAKPLTFDAQIGREARKVTLKPTGRGANGKNAPPPPPEPAQPPDGFPADESQESPEAESESFRALDDA